jgi:hypothetical protein
LRIHRWTRVSPKRANGVLQMWIKDTPTSEGPRRGNQCRPCWGVRCGLYSAHGILPIHRHNHWILNLRRLVIAQEGTVAIQNVFCSFQRASSRPKVRPLFV